jgi:pimeloyl-ACP methyl ester carboxylesterase/ketosteroid isomerase-like protein
MRASRQIEAEVLQALDSFGNAVATRDLEGTMQLFASDDDVVLQASESGTLAIGPEELRAFFTRLYARPVGFSWEWTHRLVSSNGDVAWFFADGVEIVTEGDQRHRLPYRMSGVLQRRSGRWVWLQVHGSEPARAPEEALGGGVDRRSPDPATVERAELEYVEASDGTAIACHVAGNGPPLVLVHGTSADHTRWAPILSALGARFTTYAMDRRGRGTSADGGQYSIDHEFDDVAAVIDAIGGDVNVVGHSYGAVCSLEAAMRTPRVRRLVLYEPPLPVGIEIYPPGLVERLDQLLDAGDREGVVSTFLREVVRMPPSELDTLRRDPSWDARVAAAHTIPRELRCTNTYQPDFGRFATLGVPTLLLVGGDSPPFLVEPTRRLHESIPGSRLAVMPGQQHVAMNTAPQLFLEHVLDFLA